MSLARRANRMHRHKIRGCMSMMLNTKEHYDLMAQFDREFAHERLDKESKELWSKGRIYQSGRINGLFLAYRSGYAFRKTYSEAI